MEIIKRKNFEAFEGRIFKDENNFVCFELFDKSEGIGTGVSISDIVWSNPDEFLIEFNLEHNFLVANYYFNNKYICSNKIHFYG